MNARVVTFAVALVAACSTSEPAPKSFDDSRGQVVIVVGNDGFVRCDDRRIPLEAAVLELRQRTRTMSTDDLGHFVVDVSTAPQPDQHAADAARAAMNRLVDELQVMGVRQVVFH